MLATTPEAMANSEVQAGVVMLATSTSPGCICPKSCGPPRTGWRGDGSHASPDALDHIAGLILRCRRHPSPEHVTPGTLRQ